MQFNSWNILLFLAFLAFCVLHTQNIFQIAEFTSQPPQAKPMNRFMCCCYKHVLATHNKLLWSVRHLMFPSAIISSLFMSWAAQINICICINIPAHYPTLINAFKEGFWGEDVKSMTLSHRLHWTDVNKQKKQKSKLTKYPRKVVCIQRRKRNIKTYI